MSTFLFYCYCYYFPLLLSVITTISCKNLTIFGSLANGSHNYDYVDFFFFQKQIDKIQGSSVRVLN